MQWSAPDAFCSIGVEGIGTVTVREGGFVAHGYGWLGWAPGSEGYLTNGDGTLIVQDYAVCNLTDADNDSLTIGRAGQGTVAVRFDGELISEGRLRVAELGGSYGQLWVEMGGSVAVGGQMAVGCVADAVGDVTVGDGGRLDVHNHLLIGGDAGIGNGGTGTFIVGEDGYVSADHVRVGDAEGGTGELTITGPNALLEVGPELSPENHSQLEIGPRGYGFVTVVGFDSTWSIDGVLTVGGLPDAPGGTGMLSVEDQSLLYVGGMLRVWPGSTVNLADVDITVGDGVWLSGTLSGSGTINGNLENDGGLVSPGTSTGVIFVGGDYTQHSGGALHIQIGGPIPGDGFDQLAVAGMASLGGLLDVSFIDDFTPQAGDQFDIVTFGNCFGDFETVRLPDNSGGVSYCVTMVGNAVTFLAAVPADFNCDDVVDLTDFDIFVACMSGAAIGPPTDCGKTDLTGDAHVDLADFGEFQRSFGWPDR